MLRVVKPEDSDRVGLFAANLFTTAEPMTKALAVPVQDMVQLFQPVVTACCCSGLSFMLEVQEAEEPEAQQGSAGVTIVCLSLALPYTQYKALQWPDVPSARPASAIMGTLPKLPPGQEAAAVYMFLWGTHSRHMGKGHIRAAVGASMQAARQAGFCSLVADVTNVVSQHLAMSHFGFVPMEPRVRYADHEAFRGVQGTECIIRAVKHLADEPAAAAEAEA